MSKRKHLSKYKTIFYRENFIFGKPLEAKEKVCGRKTSTPTLTFLRMTSFDFHNSSTSNFVEVKNAV